jgi:hypothetical protein
MVAALKFEFVMLNNQGAKARVEAAFKREAQQGSGRRAKPERNTKPTPARWLKGPNICGRCASLRKLSRRGAACSHCVVAFGTEYARSLRAKARNLALMSKLVRNYRVCSALLTPK